MRIRTHAFFFVKLTIWKYNELKLSIPTESKEPAPLSLRPSITFLSHFNYFPSPVTFVRNQTFPRSTGGSYFLVWLFKRLVIVFVSFLNLFSDIIIMFLVFLMHSVLVFKMLLVHSLHVLDAILDAITIVIIEFVKIFVREVSKLRCRTNDPQNDTRNGTDQNPVIHGKNQNSPPLHLQTTTTTTKQTITKAIYLRQILI